METNGQHKPVAQVNPEKVEATGCRQKRSYTPNDLLTDPETTEYLGLASGTLTQWRHRGTGPRFIKLGSSVRYQFSDIVKYLEQQKSN